MQHRPAAVLTPAVMVHFYRGVMDRATSWRSRIDTTTNWAVITSGTIASFLLSDPQHPHIIAVVGMFLLFAFLCIEARRFRFYDLWSGWIRIMETDYFAILLRDNMLPPTAQWHDMLACDLQDPHFKINFLEAVGRRLRHNYFALLMFMLMVWVDKLVLETRSAAVECSTVVECASLGPIPGILVLGVVALFYISLIGIMIFTPRLVGTGTEIINRNLVFRRMVAPNAAAVGFKRHADYVLPPESTFRIPEED